MNLMHWIDWGAVAYVSLGGVLGYWGAIGRLWLERRLDEQQRRTEETYQEVREMNDYVHERYGDEAVHAGENDPIPKRRFGRGQDSGDQKESFLHQWAIAIVVVLTAISAIYFAQVAQNRLDAVNEKIVAVKKAQQSLDDDQAEFSKQVTCQADLLATTILALKARSTFSQQQASVTLIGDLAQLKFLESVIDPATSTTQPLQEYMLALKRKIKATRDQLAVRVDNPYPTSSEVLRCRTVSKPPD